MKQRTQVLQAKKKKKKRKNPTQIRANRRRWLQTHRTPNSSALMKAIGSYNGKIYIFDLKGNELKRVKAHAASVSDLSLDKTCEYLASSSIDGGPSGTQLLVGKVIVQALELKENNVMDFRQPVRCVAMDPEYAKSSSRCVVSGGMVGQLIMNEKGISRESGW
jgi:hypothetical protein